jgi:hypothetical protein
MHFDQAYSPFNQFQHTGYYLAPHQCQQLVHNAKTHWYMMLTVAVVEGWLDLAKLVASDGSKSKSPYEDLAYKIGAASSVQTNCTFSRQQHLMYS